MHAIESCEVTPTMIYRPHKGYTLHKAQNNDSILNCYNKCYLS